MGRNLSQEQGANLGEEVDPQGDGKKQGDWIRTNHITMHGKVTIKPITYMPTTLLI